MTFRFTNGVPLLLVDRQMAPVRNYAIQSTGSSIVYMLTTGLPWQQNNTIATTHTECCVALCNNKGGHFVLVSAKLDPTVDTCH